ncbi:MAG: DUF1638 domain-containing protein [Methanimicrococcus sp.]|nr:DUF1638 domain-containing protein [Methanimicrococcus sp.]
MTKIGILACKMLQDEIVYLIQNDPDIHDIVVVENGEHSEFVEKLDKFNISYKLIPSIDDVLDIDPSDESDSFSLVVWNLQLGLHEFPKKLKEEVYNCVEVFAKKVNGIYVLYGLCGNVLGKIESDFKSLCPACPVVILRDNDGEIVDDCIGATIGGRRAYLSLLKSFKGVGTFIFTPMYSASIDEFFGYTRRQHTFTEEQIVEMNRYMLKAANYKRVANLETGLHFNENTEEKLQKFATKYELEIIQLSGGNQEIFWNCYEKLKSMV